MGATVEIFRKNVNKGRGCLEPFHMYGKEKKGFFFKWQNFLLTSYDMAQHSMMELCQMTDELHPRSQ